MIQSLRWQNMYHSIYDLASLKILIHLSSFISSRYFLRCHRSHSLSGFLSVGTSNIKRRFLSLEIFFGLLNCLRESIFLLTYSFPFFERITPVNCFSMIFFRFKRSITVRMLLCEYFLKRGMPKIFTDVPLYLISVSQSSLRISFAIDMQCIVIQRQK